MAIIKVILGILVVVVAFTIPSLWLTIRYLGGRKEDKDKEKETIDKAGERPKKPTPKTPREIWWGYFKPLAAIPVAWYLYHLLFYLMSSDLARAIWDIHWHYLMVIELAVIALNSIINKDTPYEKRTSRKLMVATYVQTFIIAGIIIIFRIGWSETAANLNRAMLSMLVNSKTELQAEDTEKLTKAYRAKPALEKMDELHEKAEKLNQLDEKARVEFFSEFEKMESWKAEAQKVYAVPEERKIDWRKFWPFGKPPKEVRHLCGTLTLPADGTMVDKDVNGQELWYKEEEYVHFLQLGSPGKFTVVNLKPQHPTWSTDLPEVTSGQTKCSDKIQLMAAGGKEIIVQVRIIPRRS